MCLFLVCYAVCEVDATVVLLFLVVPDWGVSWTVPYSLHVRTFAAGAEVGEIPQGEGRRVGEEWQGG